MADPLLTSLCAICHIEQPKYKCPRCTIRTCSLACTKRHKAWSSCNGIRDATAYVPPSKLKTPAGVDHDFNFLSSIERAVQRSEKEIVEERQLLRPQDLRPIEVRSVQYKTGRDGKKRRVLVTEVLRGDRPHGHGKTGDMLSSPQATKRLSNFGILLRRAPAGLTRQKENGTRFNRNSGRVNWQVEWLLLPSNTEAATSGGDQDDGTVAKVDVEKILATALDDTPLYRAFLTGKRSFNDLARREQQRKRRNDDEDEEDETRDKNATNPNPRPKKRRKYPHKPGQSLATAQDTETGAWHPGRYCLQGGPRGTWTPYTRGPAAVNPTEAEDEAQRSRYAFFVVGTTSTAAAAAGQTVVHAVDAAVPLGEALRDMTVLEFPTIYVLENGAPLPSILLLEPKPVRLTTQKKKRDNQQSGSKGAGKGGSKKLRRNLEEGELPGDGEDQSDDAEDDDDRVADIVAEESLGEDDDEDDDSTSSSGSDSELDEGMRAALAAKLALLKKRQS